MKSLHEIHESILGRFSSLTGLSIQDGTVLDNISYAVSDAVYQAYLEIENSRNPHLYSNLSGAELDQFGYLVSCVREPDEPDDSYLHRLIEWLPSSEAANTTSIENALINLQHSSYASYVPFIYGVGTAAIYIIPNSYDDDVVSSAILEVRQKIKSVKAADSYIEYIVPPQKQIDIAAHIEYEDDADTEYVFSNVREKIRKYINGIPIGDKLEIGEINKIGINEPGVDYFVTIQLYINEEPANNLSFLQTIHNKFVFNTLTV